MKHMVIEVDPIENDPIKAIGPFRSDIEAITFMDKMEGCFYSVPIVSRNDYEKDLVDDFGPAVHPIDTSPSWR